MACEDNLHPFLRTGWEVSASPNTKDRALNSPAMEIPNSGTQNGAEINAKNNAGTIQSGNVTIAVNPNGIDTINTVIKNAATASSTPIPKTTPACGYAFKNCLTLLL